MAKAGYRLHIVTVALLLLSGIGYSQGYRIEIDAPDFAGREVILAEYFTNRMVPQDTAQISLTGKAVLEGPKAFDGGMYIAYFDSKYYFDFLMDKDQHFSIKTDSADMISGTVFSGSEENRIFYTYKQYLAKKKDQQKEYQNQLAVAKNEADSSAISKKIDKLNAEMKNYIEEMIARNKDSFFAVFLKAMQENNAPDSILKGSKREQDSIRYVYYKQHYFDHFDLSDIRLLHTPLYEPKVKTYINRVVPQYPDSLIVAVDKLIEISRSNDAIFRYMLITLFNNFAESKLMGMDKVYFHIAEKYYIPEATWSSEDFLSKLQENLEKSKPTFIGNTAPDFQLRGIPRDHFAMAEMDTAIKNDPHVGFFFNLSEVPAEYTILYFWEADCGHCQKSTPKLYEVFEKYKEDGVKVVAVHVINSVEGKNKWIDFVNEHELYDWINCWSPYSNEFRTEYNLISFPQLFLLDKDKKILAKNLTPEQVDDILQRFLN